MSVMDQLLASISSKSLLIERGQTVEGEIVSISDHEIVVDLGVKAEGIINFRDLPEGMKKSLKVGDKISAIVQEPENESGQIVLSVQRPESNESSKKRNIIDEKQWEDLAKKYPNDTRVKGKVTKITQFGVFVQLEEGIEGLIHSSKLGPEDNFEVGQEISVLVDSIDTKKQRISLAPVITSTKGLIYK